MGIFSWTKDKGSFTLGLRSTKRNVTESTGRMRGALSETKGMISSLNPNADDAEEHQGQFTKINTMSAADKAAWKKMAQAELIAWLAVLSLLFIYTYYYSFGLSVALAFVAFISRSVLLVTQLYQIEAKPDHHDDDVAQRG